MPCGGIYYIGKPHNVRVVSDHVDAFRGIHECFHCGKKDPEPDHTVIEWDADIHGDCIEPFLLTAEGELVLLHGHPVYRKEADGSITTLHAERTPQ